MHNCSVLYIPVGLQLYIGDVYVYFYCDMFTIKDLLYLKACSLDLLTSYTEFTKRCSILICINFSSISSHNDIVP